MREMFAMKRNFICFSLAIILLFSSCATAYMPLSQVPNAQELGSISASFEINVKTGIGFLGGAGIGMSGTGGVLIGSGIGSIANSKDTTNNPGGGLIAAGALFAVAGLGLALIQDLVINLPKENRINKAAREALLAAARQRYSEDIDVRDIRYTYVQELELSRTHQYDATGIVIKTGL